MSPHHEAIRNQGVRRGLTQRTQRAAQEGAALQPAEREVVNFSEKFSTKAELVQVLLEIYR